MPPSAQDVLRLVPPPLRGERGVHVVGGAVRDVLLGREPRELDLVVEGDAVALARRIGDAVVVHDRFGTATARVDGTAVDLATARRERYPRPGALPDVVLGVSVAEDLERRDFTVNAMAVHLADGAFAAVPGAREDLAARRLRVLHGRSFADDPTRLLRMARYAARLGFAPDDATASAAAAAVAAGALDTVSGSRLGAELRLLLREPQPEALVALAAHGLGTALLGPGFAPRGDRIRAAMALCPPDGDERLAALAAALPGAALAERLAALDVPAAERDVVARAASEAPAVAAFLAAGPAPSALWERLRRLPVEAVAVAGALDPAAAVPAVRWLGELRHVQPAISGQDLLDAGLRGPAVGRGLEAAMRARLDGRAPDRRTQLDVALDEG